MSDHKKNATAMRRKTFFLLFGTALLICILGAIGNALNLSTQATYAYFGIILIVFLILALVVSNRFTRPFSQIQEVISELKKGHIHARCNIKKNQIANEIDAFADYYAKNVVLALQDIADGKIPAKNDIYDSNDIAANAVNNAASTINSVLSDMQAMLDGISHGCFDTRCNVNKYNGKWRELTENINSSCEAAAKPIEELNDILQHFTVNDFSHSMSGDYGGLFKVMAESLKAHEGLIRQFQELIIQLSNGDLQMLDQLEIMGKLSENDRLIPALITLMKSIDNLVNEVGKTANEAENGNIDYRPDGTKFSGGFKYILDGFSRTLDAISVPLSETMTVLNNMAICDFSVKCEGSYNGDFKKLTDSVNLVLKTFNQILTVVNELSEGNIRLLDTLKSTGKMSEKDKLIPSFVKLMETIKATIDESVRISNAAAEGRLDVRGDSSKFSGEFMRIIESFNNALDLVQKPILQIKDSLISIANGNFGGTIDGEFKGEYKELVDAMNMASNELQQLTQEIAYKLTQVSQGNFNLEETRSFSGSLEAISKALNAITDNLNEFLGSVSEAAAEVASNSTQVSHGSQLLSQGATEQASVVEELTASITEIKERTNQNAIGANKANELVKQVKMNAENGKVRMSEMVKSMNDISESSLNISKIIKVIDDIAFQTNILSLNAAVEAARAGQYGKGFAVVAEEVRNLAAKSANAAKNTASLIESSLEKVNTGAKIAKDTAEAFNGIVTGVDQALTLVSEIADTSAEQATGISQIDQGLNQVSQVIQTNSAIAEEGASSSEELSNQSAALNEKLAQFKLRGKGNTDKKVPYKNVSEKVPNRTVANEKVPEKPTAGIDKAASDKLNKKKNTEAIYGDFGKY